MFLEFKVWGAQAKIEIDPRAVSVIKRAHHNPPATTLRVDGTEITVAGEARTVKDAILAARRGLATKS